MFKFFAKLNGWFAGVVIDLRRNIVILFNDRFGLHRVYYSETDAGFYFASEAKALIKVLPQHRRLNEESLAEFFSCGCPLRGKTLFAGLSVLPAGATWTFSPGQKPVRGKYFDSSEWKNQGRLGLEEFYERLRETFARVVPRYLRGREKVGVSLTGGVDSRMFMAWCSAAPASLPCYTFGGMFRDSIDVKLARNIAAICRQPHEVLTVGDDFLSQFPKLLDETVYSNPITITGITAPSRVEISQNSQYQINCAGSFTRNAGVVRNNETICVRHSAAGSLSTLTDTVLTVGGVSDTFTSTTVVDKPLPGGSAMDVWALGLLAPLVGYRRRRSARRSADRRNSTIDRA